MANATSAMRVAIGVSCLSALLLTGCASMGPATIGRDRLDYDSAISTSWKRTMLLNLVKLRYGDSPMFTDVASIINSYTLETTVTLSGTLTASPGSELGNAGASGHYADRPTITYHPLLGEQFTRSLMTPIPPRIVMSLIQSGWPADLVLQMMVSSINGVQNRFGASARARGADPEFQKIGATLRRIQASGTVGMRIDKTKDGEWAVMSLRRTNVTPELLEDIQTLRELLGIRLDAEEIHVVYGSAPQNDEELAVVTRSMLEILLDTAAAIEVPDAHVADGSVTRTAVFDTDAVVGYQPMIRIRSGRKKPDNEFVSIPYADYWFWIDNRDYRSKSIYSFLMILFSLTHTGPIEGQPVLTIPTG